jgi:hypothetical protein
MPAKREFPFPFPKFTLLELEAELKWWDRYDQMRPHSVGVRSSELPYAPMQKGTLLIGSVNTVEVETPAHLLIDETTGKEYTGVNGYFLYPVEDLEQHQLVLVYHFDGRDERLEVTFNPPYPPPDAEAGEM